MASRKRVQTPSPSRKKSVPAKKAASSRADKAADYLRQAQKLANQASKTEDCGEEVRLATQALQLSPDCADAYLILAQHTFHAQDALPFFAEARRAAGKVLGKDAFKKHVGAFWNRATTRPYMKSCGGLAECLWSTGCREDAVKVWREMLKLNPRDDQGVRYPLVAGFLEMQRPEDASTLLRQFNESSAGWDYHWALLGFQREGDTTITRKLLKQARKTNKHVVRYLLKDDTPPDELPETIKPGSKAEAALYVNDASGAWRQTSGAISWLRKVITSTPGKAELPPEGPTAASKQKLQELAQTYGLVYQATVHQFPTWIEEGHTPVRPWVVVMVNYNERLIVAQELLMETPTAEVVWDRLKQGLLQPFAGKAQRPSEIQVYEHPVWESLRPHFQEIGIDIIYRRPVDEIDFILDQLKGLFTKGPPERGLLESPEITPAIAGAFYGACAEYYREAPWQFCSDDRPVEISFAEKTQKSKYAVVMGQAGMAYGLTLYDHAESLYDLWSGDLNPHDVSGHAASLTVMFGEPFEMTAVDLDALERNKWLVAAPEAYPSVLRTDPEGSFRSPTAEELELVEAALRVIPGFAARHHRERQAEETVRVPVTKGKKSSSRKVRVAWYHAEPPAHDHDHDHDGNCMEAGGNGACDSHDHDHLPGS